eukprot:COSAG01_NODE_1634_length_9665_cov_3.661196_3_plen_55_part_00
MGARQINLRPARAGARPEEMTQRLNHTIVALTGEAPATQRPALPPSVSRHRARE